MFYKIGVKYNEENYHIMWINPDANKRELFIHFITSSGFKEKELTVNKDGVVVDKMIHFDHLSFHSDGKIHIKHKTSIRQKKYSHKLNSTNLYDYPKEKVIPLICNSYFNVGSNEYMKIVDNENTIIFNVPKRPFTILVFQVSKFNQSSFINEYLARKFNLIQTPILLDMDDNLHLLLIAVVYELPVEIKNGYLKNQLMLSNTSRNDTSIMIKYQFLPQISDIENMLFTPNDI